MSARFAVALACLAAPAAWALCPAPAPKACAAFFESDQVFVGKVLEVSHASAERIVYTVEVGDVLRGKAGKVERVSSENDSGRWIGEAGKTYVLFASKGKVGGRCSTLDEPEQVADTLRQIRALKGVMDATIEGEAVAGGGGPGAASVAGTKVRARSAAGVSYSTVTDARGAFSLRVPAGTYTVKADAFVPSAYSRYSGRPFRVAAGQCAQFQFSRYP
jgi:hypothetical protein